MINLTWIITIFSIAGVVLNIKRRRICFYIWACTNAAWAIVDFCMGIYAQGALFTVYFALSIWGIIAWRRDKYFSRNKE